MIGAEYYLKLFGGKTCRVSINAGHLQSEHTLDLVTAWTFAGCTPLNTVPILFCVKAYSKNRHYRVFIMIKIGQTHVLLKDYVHIHQIGSHFVGGYRLDFLATGQEPRRSFCKLLVLGNPRLL